MTRAQPESTIHLDILRYLRTVLPRAVIHHSPNEFGMAGDGIARQMAKARHMGTVKGWPDLEVLLNGGVMFFEVKAPGGRLTQEQRQVGDELLEAGFYWAVVRSIDDVREMLASWGVRTIESPPQTILPVPGNWSHAKPETKVYSVSFQPMPWILTNNASAAPSNIGPMTGTLAERFDWLNDILRDE